MFKYIVFFALLAIAFAAPKAAPQFATVYSAPGAAVYSAGYGGLGYAGYGYGAAPLAYGAYGGYYV